MTGIHHSPKKWFQDAIPAIQLVLQRISIQRFYKNFGIRYMMFMSHCFRITDLVALVYSNKFNTNLP